MRQDVVEMLQKAMSCNELFGLLTAQQSTARLLKNVLHRSEKPPCYDLCCKAGFSSGSSQPVHALGWYNATISHLLMFSTACLGGQPIARDFP